MSGELPGLRVLRRKGRRGRWISYPVGRHGRRHMPGRHLQDVRVGVRAHLPERQQLSDLHGPDDERNDLGLRATVQRRNDVYGRERAAVQPRLHHRPLRSGRFAVRHAELATRSRIWTRELWLQAVASAGRLAMTRRTANGLRIYRRSGGITLARRIDVVAAVGVMLKSLERADCVEPIRVPPAKYVPESESGRMS